MKPAHSANYDPANVDDRVWTSKAVQAEYDYFKTGVGIRYCMGSYVNNRYKHGI